MSDKVLRATYRLLLVLAPLLFALPATAFALCATDVECSDGLFCNGIERCSPGAPGADLNGCTAGTPECTIPPFDECDESRARCLCRPRQDSDGDGHDAPPCGDDCDDSDSRRYPGNVEICDADNHDDDCNPSTFGEVDADKDGFFDGQCCNHNDFTGQNLCGDDCDDSNPAITPGAMICGAVPGEVLICNPGGGFRGGFQQANCGGVDEQVCIPQPNGTGVCEMIKKPKNP